MIKIDIADIEKISRQLDAFYTAYKGFVYYTELHDYQHKNAKIKNFWNFIEFMSLSTLLINWNEIFGITKKNESWKQITFEVPEYIKLLYKEGEFTYSTWTDYRNYINELCNDFIIFPDPYHHSDQKYNLEGIKCSLEITHDWLYKLVSCNNGLINSEYLNRWPVANKNYIKNLKREILINIRAHT